MPFNVINKSVLKLKKVFQYRKIGDASHPKITFIIIIMTLL